MSGSKNWTFSTNPIMKASTKTTFDAADWVSLRPSEGDDPTSTAPKDRVVLFAVIMAPQSAFEGPLGASTPANGVEKEDEALKPYLVFNAALRPMFEALIAAVEKGDLVQAREVSGPLFGTLVPEDFERLVAIVDAAFGHFYSINALRRGSAPAQQRLPKSRKPTGQHEDDKPALTGSPNSPTSPAAPSSPTLHPHVFKDGFDVYWAIDAWDEEDDSDDDDEDIDELDADIAAFLKADVKAAHRSLNPKQMAQRFNYADMKTEPDGSLSFALHDLSPESFKAVDVLTVAFYDVVRSLPPGAGPEDDAWTFFSKPDSNYYFGNRLDVSVPRAAPKYWRDSRSDKDDEPLWSGPAVSRKARAVTWSGPNKMGQLLSCLSGKQAYEQPSGMSRDYNNESSCGHFRVALPCSPDAVKGRVGVYTRNGCSAVFGGKPKPKLAVPGQTAPYSPDQQAMNRRFLAEEMFIPVLPFCKLVKPFCQIFKALELEEEANGRDKEKKADKKTGTADSGRTASQLPATTGTTGTGSKDSQATKKGTDGAAAPDDKSAASRTSVDSDGTKVGTLKEKDKMNEKDKLNEKDDTKAAAGKRKEKLRGAWKKATSVFALPCGLGLCFGLDKHGGEVNEKGM